MPDGVYIRGSVQGYPLLFTTDTGASKTIISNRVFESLKPEDRPELEKTSKLVGASGVSIKERGKGIFCLKLGSVKMEVEAIVAEIDDDGLLGVDILQNGKNGPADLLMSKGVLMIDKKEIPIIQVGVNNRVRKVTAADHFVIPAQTECVIDVYIERREYDDFSSEKEYVVEPTDHFQAEYPLQMASTLVDINKACTCKVRMLNPFPTAMSIKQDAVIGRAEPIEGIPIVITNEEDSSETENHVAVRRIKFVTSEHAQSLPEYKARRVQAEDSTEIPSHLVDLYEKTSQGLNDEQKQEGIMTFRASTRPKEELGKLQREDPDIGPILPAKATGNKPSSQEMVTCSPATRHYEILWDSLVVYDGILLFIKRDGSGEYLQFIVPLSMRKEVLFQMHNSLVSGHLSCKKTKEKILQRFYWYSLKDEVVLHIQKCDTCAADKRPPKVPRAPIGSLRVGAPGDCIATDYLGPLPITDRGHRYILLFTDHFTKNVEVIPVGDMTAEVCAQKLLNEVISRWGCPLSIHSDQGRTYESRVFKKTMQNARD